MMKEKIRELLHATPFVPFYIHTASGQSILISHPEFVMATPSESPRVIVEEPNGRTHTINVMLITSVEEAPPQEKAQ
jgi:hypothetical protein